MIKRAVILITSASLVWVAAVPAGAQVRVPLSQLPDGDTRPVVTSVVLENPARHNSMLEADLTIEASDNDGILRYEYRWNRGTLGAIHETTTENPTVSYASITPDSSYALQVRAVDLNGWKSDWAYTWHGTTSSVPNVIIAGDSIASGYRRQWFTGTATCTDSTYSYGNLVAQNVAKGLPASWVPNYTNIAWAGAGVGNMVDGGTDSCGTSHPSQVDQIDRISLVNTWNIVVITAGINSTNWTDVVVGLTKDTTFSFSPGGDRQVCEAAVRDKWNIDAKRTYVRTRTADVTNALSSRTNAKLYWTGYYDVTGAELAPRWTPIGTPCQDEMEYALNELHAAIRSGLGDDATWVDINLPIATQKWAGWPHPDEAGHRAIANEVSAAINS